MGTHEDILEGSRKIRNIQKGCLIGRFGTIEFEGLFWTEKFPDSEWPIMKRNQLEKNAGIFPSDMASVKGWAARMKEAICAADILAVGWYPPMVEAEKELLHSWGWKGAKIPLRSLESYYVAHEDRWTTMLNGKNVCVVTSFADTAAKQVAKGEENVWPQANGSIWPPYTNWYWVQTGYAPSLAYGQAGWEDCESWEKAVDYVVTEVLKTDASIVLIGCGGLGMVIGHRLKKAGKICIVMGGAIQVLFGIKGQRWATHPTISKFWNKHWVWPSEDETPKGSAIVEGGCYWKNT